MPEFGFSEYFETSALQGRGIVELRESIRRSVDWGSLPTVTSPDLLLQIRKAVDEERARGVLILNASNLTQAMQFPTKTHGDRALFQQQVETCLVLLESRGLVRRLDSEGLVLLAPELLDEDASAIAITARENPDGTGSIYRRA
jgi:hypothetical protein